MDGLLAGRLALVTGAGSGIGDGIALGMAQHGARIIADIDGQAATRVSHAIGGGARSFQRDVVDRAACDALAAAVRRELGPVSVLVNNAGIIRRGAVSDADARADWDATLAVNLEGPYNMTAAFLDQLRESKSAIVNIGAIQSFVALPNSAACTASKGGVRALTKTLAIELAARHPRQRHRPRPHRHAAQRQGAREPGLYKDLRGPHPLGPHRHPADVAPVAVFLASDMVRYITGVTLPVDGGYLAL